MAHELGLLEAAATGLLQGVAEIFPISGLGHAVLITSLSHTAAADLDPATSDYLYSWLRIAIGLALLVHFRREWMWVVRGGVGALAPRSSHAAARRWSALVLIAVVPSSVAIAILAARAGSLTSRPLLAAGCLAGNGLLLLLGWLWFVRSPRSGGLSGTHRARLTRREEAEAFVAESSVIRSNRMAVIGVLPLAVLVPGLSGVGLVVCAGLMWGLTQEQAARLALLVITPPLLVWGAVDAPDLGSAQFDGVRTAVLVACGVAFVAAYLVISLVLRYFRTASLRPFGLYCLLAGAAAVAWLVA